MNDLSWAALVRLVHQRANLRCEYCQTSQKITGQAMHVDHIDPNGPDHTDNLCLACSSCNQSKARVMTAPDPEEGTIVALFNPRSDKWVDHFVWVDDGKQVQGITPVGRATVERLKMNHERIVAARILWIGVGWHPPSED